MVSDAIGPLWPELNASSVVLFLYISKGKIARIQGVVVRKMKSDEAAAGAAKSQCCFGMQDSSYGIAPCEEQARQIRDTHQSLAHASGRVIEPILGHTALVQG